MLSALFDRLSESRIFLEFGIYLLSGIKLTSKCQMQVYQESNVRLSLEKTGENTEIKTLKLCYCFLSTSLYGQSFNFFIYIN